MLNEFSPLRVYKCVFDYNHNGWESQSSGNPIADASTEGVDVSSVFSFVLKESPRPIESSQYAIQHVIAYSLLPSMFVVSTHAPRSGTLI